MYKRSDLRYFECLAPTQIKYQNFKCVCKSGYIGNGKKCERDPCYDCDAKATCQTTKYGGKQCVCKAGYRGNGKSCEKIDPCEKCDDNAICKGGAYSGNMCVCKPDYEGDGETCTKVSNTTKEEHIYGREVT